VSSYELRIVPSARRALGRLPLRFSAAVVAFMQGPLIENPWRVGKPLRDDLVGLHAARVGMYRVMYRIIDSEDVVLVTRIDHRADIYRPR
jgi:mRNA-degrading endonuclease RelE of RelBE toxin-antitoxin system